MGEQSCSGMTALGPCQKRGIYRVDDERACGVHLAQVVKFHLEFRPQVVVTCDTRSEADDGA